MQYQVTFNDQTKLDIGATSATALAVALKSRSINFNRVQSVKVQGRGGRWHPVEWRAIRIQAPSQVRTLNRNYALCNGARVPT